MSSALSAEFEPTPEQEHFEQKSSEIQDWVVQPHSDDMVVRDASRAMLWESNKIIAVTRPPGTSNTDFVLSTD